MIHLVEFIFTCYGLTVILVESKIAAPVRKGFTYIGLRTLINCHLCVSFWMGMLVYGTQLETVSNLSWLDLVKSGALASGTSWILFCLTVHWNPWVNKGR